MLSSTSSGSSPAIQTALLSPGSFASRSSFVNLSLLSYRTTSAWYFSNKATAPIPLKDISDKQRISLKYLEQIVTPLAKAGLVSSVRGAQGGYRLARPAGEITSGEILRAVEGELTAIPCLASSVDCPHRSQCHTLDFWSGLNDLINKYVDGITLEQLRTMPEVPEEQENCE